MKMLVSEKLSQHKYKTPEGYLLCQNAILSRVGKQTYMKSELYPDCEDGSELIEVDRKAEDVFSEEAMASFEGKPVTLNHPAESVCPENYNELAIGHVSNIRRSKTEDGVEVMIGDLLITDPDCIEAIENGDMDNLSCGYDTDITDGPNPRQTNIRGNHVALCQEGRAGCARIIDSAILLKDDEITPEESEKTMGYAKNLISMKGINAVSIGKPTTNEIKISVLNDKDFSNTVDLFRKDVFDVYNVDKDFGTFFVKLKSHFKDSVSKCDKDTIIRLIHEEEGAIESYNLAISEALKNNCSEDAELYNHIKSEEEEHLQELNELLEKMNGKKMLKDSATKGTLIQEFGKQADQYKIIKIVKNTIYAEDVNNGKTVLFKKDKEGIDWDVITKTEINDSIAKDTQALLNELQDLREELEYYEDRKDSEKISKIEKEIQNVRAMLSSGKFTADSFDKEEIINTLKSKLSNIKYDKIEEDDNKIIIKFNDLKNIKDAMKIIKNDFDAEIKGLNLIVYEKIEEKVVMDSANDKKVSDAKLDALLPEITERLEKIGVDKIKKYGQLLVKQGGYKDFAVRFPWDVLRLVAKTSEIVDWYDKYDANDSHIYTLINRALRNLGISNKEEDYKEEIKDEISNDENTIWYLETPSEVATIELTPDEVPSKLIDFINDLIEAGYKTFKLFSNMSNNGPFGLLARVVNGKIKEINDSSKKKDINDVAIYRRQFYVKAIEDLKEKLEKLKKDKTLNANNKEYQEAKEEEIEEIKNQIDKYNKDLIELNK